MHFSQQQSPTGILLTLSGAFTFKDHQSFRTVLDLLKASTGQRHVLDLSGIEFLDSAGLGMLLVAEDEVGSGGATLTIRRPSPQVRQLFELAALDTLFTIEH